MCPAEVDVVTPNLPDDGQGDEMSTGTYQDLDDDVCVHQMESMTESHESLMAESRGNAQVAHNIVRQSAARKFNEVDPLESAAAEVILKKAQ